eukprot:TRINITY_DN46385_c0_g1_i1.p2 TRINITY_DN46385_c0_g1~~TRINITY_DN46385_c0_g1_i1.p2  ORF type:complete len:116 (-),score=43.84 TRINITY_DN46385_c0_g1_i1:393-740(-)
MCIRDRATAEQGVEELAKHGALRAAIKSRLTAEKHSMLAAFLHHWHLVVSPEAENRMQSSAVATCLFLAVFEKGTVDLAKCPAYIELLQKLIESPFDEEECSAAVMEMRTKLRIA